MLTVNIDSLNIRANDRVLDLGCGEGRHALGIRHSLPEANIIGIDLDFGSLTTALNRLPETDIFIDETHHKKNTCHFIQADGAQLPFLDASFDCIICSEVLEHIEDYTKFLHEIKRLLKPEGRLAISVPRQWPEAICWSLSSEYHNVPGGHIRIFNAKKLRREISNTGFTYTCKHWAHALHVPYWWLRCLFWAHGEQQLLVRWYHSLLVWDLMKKPFVTRSLDYLLNPLMGKSVVMYFVPVNR